MIKRYIFPVLVLAALNAFGQQDAQFSQYMFNGLIINPAYAGNKKVVNINSVYRHQWVGIEGAPRTMTLSCDGSAMKNKVGLGLNVVSDKLGAQGLFSVITSYSYKLRVGHESTLALGIAAGFSQYTMDGSKITLFDESDNAKPGMRASDFIPDAKFGVYYSKDNYYAGFSVSNVFGTRIKDAGLGEEEVVFGTQGRHYFLTSGYIFDLNQNFKLYPSFLVKEDLKGPTNIDLNSFILYNNLVWFGVSYRTSMSLFKKNNLSDGLDLTNVVALMLQFHLNEKIRVGYAYDITTSELRGYNGGSHELSLSYFFPQKRRAKMLTPRYF